MERLLQWVFAKVIRTGNLRITTAGGSSFSIGDGTGKPLAIRFTTRKAERGVRVHEQAGILDAYRSSDERALGIFGVHGDEAVQPQLERVEVRDRGVVFDQ